MRSFVARACRPRIVRVGPRRDPARAWRAASEPAGEHHRFARRDLDLIEGTAAGRR